MTEHGVLTRYLCSMIDRVEGQGDVGPPHSHTFSYIYCRTTEATNKRENPVSFLSIHSHTSRIIKRHVVRYIPRPARTLVIQHLPLRSSSRTSIYLIPLPHSSPIANIPKSKSCTQVWILSFSPHELKLLKLGDRYNNNKPRDPITWRAGDSEDYKQGIEKLGAIHHNGMENFPLFGITVVSNISMASPSSECITDNTDIAIHRIVILHALLHTVRFEYFLPNTAGSEPRPPPRTLPKLFRPLLRLQSPDLRLPLLLTGELLRQLFANGCLCGRDV